ncbi:phosphoribosylaminoimidazole-succinocarboxamide synthase [Pseudopedobacter saltans DSM 12145]|uniref:phosphoribosylaminoimidazolesuccinocarboxamide synthase n=1 Tax=Pseudopedobacter saltans (strain ATCC 51119 / DSM 12145 / JCM 21818 / CCUG 39354 / LMG 10337 / NBRC 100064 / NCIMB 13643) TaxID=762903 RepID=F0S7F3_PSESL|nr:phosphoribosylaminoimidazolesuccinocarboxamide synthase [Pseudopedobacter saltans]ADY51178.1 phosphoribosylaminoimidazole-succinocarboxamide synthase [Pseudopedobacter saltans DSM 12145]
MQLIYTGKTKDVYSVDNNQVLLKFKDDVTGEDGVFDPGANTVGLTIEGAGKSGLKMTKHFFEILNSLNIPTHYVSADLDEVSMTVKQAKVFGKGLEVICRYKAVGSFFRRYGAYCEQGQPLDTFVEVTIKDDERGDPTISEDALAMLGILSNEEYQTLKTLTKKICDIVKAELAKKGLELYDIKLEFGRDAVTNEIILIDEISGGNMRVYKNGEYIAPLDLEKDFLG